MSLRRSRLVGLALVVSLALVAGVAAYRWWQNRAPFGPQPLAAAAAVVPVDNTMVAAAVARTGVPPFTAPFAGPGDQLMLVTLTWRKPPRPLANGWFEVLLIDKRSDLKPPFIAAGGPQPDHLTIGGDGVLNSVARRYPWLRGAGAIANGDGSYTSAGVSVSVHTESSPAVLVAHFPAAEQASVPRLFATAPIGKSDLLVALVFIGPDRQIYWAQRLYG